MSFPIFEFPTLPTTTVVPENDDLFIPYMNRTYEEMAYAVNKKDNIYFPMAITSTAQNIINVPNFGAFVICVSGVDDTLPTRVVSLCKASKTGAGSIGNLGAQVGTGAWAGNAIIISSTASNFQIRHDRAGVTGNFNIRIIGTQG